MEPPKNKAPKNKFNMEVHRYFLNTKDDPLTPLQPYAWQDYKEACAEAAKHGDGAQVAGVSWLSHRRPRIATSFIPVDRKAKSKGYKIPKGTSPGPQVDIEQSVKAYRMHKDGKSRDQIAKNLNVLKTSTYKIIARGEAFSRKLNSDCNN